MKLASSQTLHVPTSWLTSDPTSEQSQKMIMAVVLTGKYLEWKGATLFDITLRSVKDQEKNEDLHVTTFLYPFSFMQNACFHFSPCQH